MKNKTYYFAHDYGARNDPKLQRMMLEMEGCDGVGIYWCLVEMLYEQGGRLRLQDLKAIAYQLHTPSARVEQVIKNFDLFENDGETFWSKSLDIRFAERQRISELRTKAIQTRWQKNTNVLQMNENSDTNKIKEKENKKEEKITTCCYQKEDEQQQRILYIFLFLKNFKDPKGEVVRFLDFNGHSDAAHIHASKWGQDKANEGQCFTQCGSVLKLCQRAYDNAVKAQDPDAWKIADGLEGIRDTAYGTYEIYTANADTSALLQKYFPSAAVQKRAGIERITLQTKQ